MTLVLAAAILLAGCAPATPPGATPTASVSAEATRAELHGLIEDVTAATAYRYRLTDDLGRWMDTAKAIRIPEASTFAAVYATWRTFLYDPASETAAELHVRTHAGSAAFGNPRSR
jgi:hypothetical protein